MASVSLSIAEENKFTDPVSLLGAFNLSVSGTFSATVTLQRSFGTGTWLDVATYDGPIEDAGVEPEGAIYRVGVKATEYTSGTAIVRLGQ